MGILETLRAENFTHDLSGKNVLVTGGTQGIGDAVACQFAELGANVTIAGRSIKDAEIVLNKLRLLAPHKDAEFDFVQFDGTLKSSSIALADKMIEKYKKTGLYVLVMTHGAAANGDPRKETSEGHEWTLAVGVLSRYITAIKLIDSLRLGGGTIISVKAAGKFDKFDVDDIELRKHKNPSFFASAGRDGAIHDIFAQEITSRTGITYYHLFPALVKTNIMSANNIRFPISWLVGFGQMVVGVTPDRYASVPVWVALTRPSYVTIQETGNESPIMTYPKREDVREKVMTWMKNVTGLEA